MQLADQCAYAHGPDDLKYVTLDERARMGLVPSAKAWRTKLCANFTAFGRCQYGHKCTFVHDMSAAMRSLSSQGLLQGDEVDAAASATEDSSSSPTVSLPAP